MPRSRKPARVKRWRDEWCLFWADALGRERRQACAALGAHTADERRELERRFREREAHEAAEVLRRGGVVAYDTPLLAALAEYRTALEERGRARAANPEARAGLAAGSLVDVRHVLSHFEGWLRSSGRERLATGQVDRPALEAYFEFVAGQPGGRGRVRSAATVNKFKRTVRVALRWLAGRRPPLFPDFASLGPAMKPLRGDTKAPVAFRPDELARFLEAALAYEAPARTVLVTRVRRGRVERFQQTEPSGAAVPVSRLFALLALTGARLGEVLALRWLDVDFARNRVTFRSQKTGRTRFLPLVGGAEGDVAPRLARVLALWKLQAGPREHVLPHEGTPAPAFPKLPWRAVRQLARLSLSPQGLRQSFCSYAASLGVPASVAALWQGHGVLVAERWYRAQLLERNSGKDFEEATGLAPYLDRLLEEGKGSVIPG